MKQLKNPAKKSDKPRGKNGGARPGAGRPKGKPEVVEPADKDFASRVLARIGQDGWRDFSDISLVKNADDLALHYLCGKDGESQFNRLLDRKYGKSVQTVNHVHDKPMEVNLHVSLSDEIKKARERAL